jgi:hypothetical protein
MIPKFPALVLVHYDLVTRPGLQLVPSRESYHHGERQFTKAV